MKKNMIYGGTVTFFKGEGDTMESVTAMWANVDTCAAIINEYLDMGYYDRYEIWGDMWDGKKWITVRLPG